MLHQRLAAPQIAGTREIVKPVKNLAVAYRQAEVFGLSNSVPLPRYHAVSRAEPRRRARLGNLKFDQFGIWLHKLLSLYLNGKGC